MLLAPWLSLWWAGLPLSLVLSYEVFLAGALLLLLLGQNMGRDEREAWFDALCWALLLTGFMCALVAFVQVFLPDWANDGWIAHSSIAGRAVGNMRQPNHLASLLVWASLAAVHLSERGAWRLFTARWTLPILLFVLSFSLVLTASRSGQACLLAMAIWACVDRQLSPGARRQLMLLPMYLLLGWALLTIWSQAGGPAFGAESRLAEGAGSPKRLLILANAWELLKQYPWTGVGWGEFNFAWTMMSLPDRALPAFDHTHNLIAQLLVELGWPLGGLILCLLGRGVWQMFKSCHSGQPSSSLLERSALVLVLLILAQAMVEFQLWYAYFLFPATFAIGLAWHGVRSSSITSMAKGPDRATHAVQLLGLLIVAISFSALADFTRVVAIVNESADGEPVLQRVLRAQQKSRLFSLQADYAAAGLLPPGPEALDAARRTAHVMTDDMILISWANSLVMTGQMDKARYLAQRAREFKSERVKAWMAHCQNVRPGDPGPFQCQPPAKTYSYRDFR
ncbi:Wzy polymerase domain-containing protein [Paucibacter sp. DJ1R-11]|uniref:PglL family O-oligosaccharyltransferase n=1 Tax=Paucibacter sp. DJ1R-11 TaxID=2893556 RepID=UPI0021E38B84|nr:O-antigen ligase family protein [Paucibacter sp. DJ1R-11]MCV2362527.1 Wzy polymerase domain-containing protein [Paucibacter sp. DJ1R-11]